jgi:hypothetical protein
MSLISIDYIPEQRRLLLGTLVFQSIEAWRSIFGDNDDDRLRHAMLDFEYDYDRFPDVAHFFCDAYEGIAAMGKEPPDSWAKLRKTMITFGLRNR